jgi:hypothetical protein
MALKAFIDKKYNTSFQASTEPDCPCKAAAMRAKADAIKAKSLITADQSKVGDRTRYRMADKSKTVLAGTNQLRTPLLNSKSRLTRQ